MRSAWPVPSVPIQQSAPCPRLQLRIRCFVTASFYHSFVGTASCVRARARIPVKGPARSASVAHATLLQQTCTLLTLSDSLDRGLFELTQAADTLVSQQLTGVTPTSCAAVLVAGLVTSLSPCTLSVLPLTIGYIGGYAAQEQDRQQQDRQQQQKQDRQQQQQQPPQQDRQQHTDATPTDTTSGTLESGGGTSGRSRPPTPPPRLWLQAVCFSAGLASCLAGLGITSSLLGRAYGSIGPGLPLAAAGLAVLMGLNLLQVVVLPLPSLDVDVRAAGLAPPVTSFLAGATFALAASPCSTPVLATLLAYAAASEDPGGGGLLLLLYSVGYVAPLLVAATATGAARRLLELRDMSAWVTPASGVLLVAGGTYALLSRLLPA